MKNKRIEAALGTSVQEANREVSQDKKIEKVDRGPYRLMTYDKQLADVIDEVVDQVNSLTERVDEMESMEGWLNKWGRTIDIRLSALENHPATEATKPGITTHPYIPKDWKDGDAPSYYQVESYGSSPWKPEEMDIHIYQDTNGYHINLSGGLRTYIEAGAVADRVRKALKDE